MSEIRIIDLFAGLGGIRKGFERACEDTEIDVVCKLTSEIKPYAIKCLKENFNHSKFVGDITKVKSEEIEDFDFLFAGFPCQPFSNAGTRQGFSDPTKGTLFWHIERILKDKSPYGFILENVEGMVKHDIGESTDEIGRTLKTILKSLNDLGYKVSWKVLDSSYFGVPQIRKRIYIVGTKDKIISLDNFPTSVTKLGQFLDKGLPPLESKFVKSLMKKFDIKELYGKKIKDKRGGSENIHSWDLEIKGKVSKVQTELLNTLLKERRKKHWAEKIGIDWMDGMPLTLEQIKTFFPKPNLEEILNDLVIKKYLRFEHPKKKITTKHEDGSTTSKREYDTTKPKGFNIVTGKLSFELNEIANPESTIRTLVASDVSRIAVPDGNYIRKLSPREGLRLCGYPDTYVIPEIKESEIYDLVGNTVVVNVIEEISKRCIEAYTNYVEVMKEKKLNVV
tara:strand:+ start:179 stop:1528 length:1350 start_codon:yes stop_codon:yes gene_type:complete